MYADASSIYGQFILGVIGQGLNPKHFVLSKYIYDGDDQQR